MRPAIDRACDGGFVNSYNIAFANMVGTVPSRTDEINYKITSPTEGALLADGAPSSVTSRPTRWRATSRMHGASSPT